MRYLTVAAAFLICTISMTYADDAKPKAKAAFPVEKGETLAHRANAVEEFVETADLEKISPKELLKEFAWRCPECEAAAKIYMDRCKAKSSSAITDWMREDANYPLLLGAIDYGDDEVARVSEAIKCPKAKKG